MNGAYKLYTVLQMDNCTWQMTYSDMRILKYNSYELKKVRSGSKHENEISVVYGSSYTYGRQLSIAKSAIRIVR